MPITPNQQRIYGFIKSYMASNEQSPTISEIGRRFQMSLASVHAVLAILEHEGLIKKIPNVARGIIVIGEPKTAGIVLPESSELVM